MILKNITGAVMPAEWLTCRPSLPFCQITPAANSSEDPLLLETIPLGDFGLADPSSNLLSQNSDGIIE